MSAAASIQQQQRVGHIPGLDGLRAFSIMIVLVGHFFLSQTSYSTMGVYIFFVISGFLITTLMYAERDRVGALDVKRFYFRRFLRLYPVLIVYLTVVCCVALLNGKPFPPIEVASVLFYFANYLTSWYGVTEQQFQLPIGQMWSLSVEEHFYLLMPAFFLLMRGRHMIRFAIALCLIPVVLRVIYLSIWPWLGFTEVLYQNSEVRMDSIAYGVLLAALFHEERTHVILKALGSTLAVLAGLALLVTSYNMGQTFLKFVTRDTFRTLAIVPLVCNVLFSPQLPWLKWVLNIKLIAWVGALSYSLYIWHGAQKYFFGGSGMEPDSVELGWWKMAGSFCCAIASYYLIEKPFLRFKTHFSPVASDAPASDQTKHL